MVLVKRIVLDVLKPHQPSVVDFSQAIAQIGEDYTVRLKVLEMDENTETLHIEVQAQAIDFAAIQEAIVELGGSLHSIDEVDATNQGNADA